MTGSKMLNRIFCALVLLGPGLVGPRLAEAAERLGEIELTDFLLEPSFLFSEPASGQFQFGNSRVQVTWHRDKDISGVVTIGNKALVGVPARYQPTATDELAFVEAFAQAETSLGRVRFGMVPLPFGAEGAGEEGHLRFPRSLVYQRRMIVLRDQGVSYSIENEGYFTHFAIHNGEGGKDFDNQMWFTATWGWAGPHLKIGASGQTGRTTPLSTDPTGTLPSLPNSAIDVNRLSRIRIANLYANWESEPFSAKIEATLGETQQDTDRFKFLATHLDLFYSTSATLGWLARFDYFNPRTDIGGSRVSEATLGVGYRSRFETSAVYLYGSKVFQENVQPDIHQVLLVWRLTPYVLTRR